MDFYYNPYFLGTPNFIYSLGLPKNMGENCECNTTGNSACGGQCTDSMCVPIEGDSFASMSGVPLVTAKIGECGKIVRISGRTDTRKFLCELGFVIGENVSVVSENSGNLILDVKGSRIAMDKMMASKIFFAPA